MHAPRIPVAALGGLLLFAASPAWGRAGPPQAGAQAGAATESTAPANSALSAIPPPPTGVQAMDATAISRYYGIVRDNDAQLDCPQLNTELQSLASDIAKLPPQPDWAALSDEMRPSVNPNVIGAGHMVASAVLSRVPVIGGVLAAVSERPPGTDARMARRFAQLQQAQQVSIAHSVLHARRARLTQLFQARACKLSDFDPPPVLEEAGTPPDGAAASPTMPLAPEPSNDMSAPSK